MKFTPGPWEVDRRRMDLHDFVVKGDDDCEIAYVDCYEVENIKETQANAHLIVAAPDMYAALKEVFELLEEHEPNWYLRGHYNRMTKALAKAEGGE